jgi:trans-aconitate 2-methyltransferase
VCRARAGALAGEEYVAADVGRMPLRIAGVRAQPDLIYARFLASHLPEPEQTISASARELEPGGLLVVEEVDSISTNVAAFDEYLEILSEMLTQHGNELFVGPRLAAMQWDANLRIQVNRSTDVRPTIRQAARMFSMNLPNWRHDPFVEATYPPEKLQRLAVELDRLTAFADTGRIVWKMRQISLRLGGKSYR